MLEGERPARRGGLSDGGKGRGNPAEEEPVEKRWVLVLLRACKRAVDLRLVRSRIGGRTESEGRRGNKLMDELRQRQRPAAMRRVESQVGERDKGTGRHCARRSSVGAAAKMREVLPRQRRPRLQLDASANGGW